MRTNIRGLKQRKMNFRSVILIVLTLLAPWTSYSQSHALKFVKKIGIGWNDEREFGWMSLVSFSPDGTMVASDRIITPREPPGAPTAPLTVPPTVSTLTLWSFPDGRRIKQLPVNAWEISGDWKYLRTAHMSSNGSAYSLVVKVVNMETGKPVASLRNDRYMPAAFSPDSRYLAETSYGKATHNSRIRVVELATGKQVSTFGKHPIHGLAMSPDGVTMATGYWDAVTLWNMLTGERLAALHGFGRYVGGLSFSKDGNLLAAGTDLRKLEIWDVHRHERIHSLDLGDGEISDIAFSPDGRLVAVGTYGNGTVWLIDVRSGKVLDHQRVSDMGCGSVAFSPDGKFLITPSTGGLITWPYDRGGTIRVFEVNAP